MRNATEVCPQCFKKFKLNIWLQKHISNTHLEYKKDTDLKKRQRESVEDDQRASKHRVQPSPYTVFQNNNSDPELFDCDAIAADAPLESSESQSDDFLSSLTYPNAGLPCAYVPQEGEYITSSSDPYYPFANEEEFNFAEVTATKGLAGSIIEALLKGNCGLKDDLKHSLKSNYHLRKKIDQMEDGLGVDSWKKSRLENITWNEQHAREPIEFWHRDIIECAKWLLRQPAYAEHLSFAPQQRFDEQGRRVYSEMHTADWWWERQTCLDDGDTVIPIIFMSDATHLTNFSGDKKAWPVYMTIGNLSASARMATAMHSVLLVALLPIAIKMRDIPLSRYNEQKNHNRMILQHVLRHILGPLMCADRRVFFAWCADGHFRHCVASPAAWIADYPEHRDLHNIKNGVCYWCECPKAEMGQLPARPYPTRNHNKYRALSVTNTAAANARLASFDVHQGSNVFWDLDCETSDLPKPDLLHTMQLGMLKHLLAWLSMFLKQHKRFEAFNDIWLSVPAYLDMAQPRRTYEEVSSWQGKEIKTMSRFLVAVLRCALRAPSASQRDVFNQAIECSRALVEFYFYSQYDSHDEQTLGLMSTALRNFHHSKDVFRQFRAGKRVTQEGKARQKELIAERDDELRSMKTKTAAQRECERKLWNEFINAEMVEHHAEGGDFNFPKIHQMLHFREQIQRYGCLKQWSTETGESSHRTQIKIPFNKSNRSGDIYTQILEHYLRSDAFAVRKLNRNACGAANTAKSGDTILPTVKGLKFLSAQGSTASKINTFAAILASVGDLNLRRELQHATSSFLVSRGVETTFEALLCCTARVYHSIQVPVTNMHGDQVIQTVRCTGEQTWHGQGPRNDWVWVQASRTREGREPAYKALRGRIPYRLLKLFNLQVLDSVFWCAFVQITIPSGGGMPERASGMVRVTEAKKGSGYMVISGGNITGAAHLISEGPGTLGTSHKAWIVNSHIDLGTWNEVYYMTEKELDHAASGKQR